jgi:hypothetical protein
MRFLAAPAFLAATLAAQETPPVAPPPPPTDLKAEEPQQLTPEQRVAQLRTELEKLQAEMAALKAIQKRGGIVGLVKSRISDRSLTTRSLSAAPAAAPKERGARLLGDGEKARLGAATKLTVDGVPVTDAEFDAVLAFA